MVYRLFVWVVAMLALFVLCVGFSRVLFLVLCAQFAGLLIANSSIVISLISGSGWAFPCFSYVMFEMSGPHKFFYLVPQGVAFISCMAVVAMVMAVFAQVCVRWVLVLPGWGDEFYLQDLV